MAAPVEDFFRRESAHLVAALVRLLGPSRVSLAEDVVQDALVTAMHAWRLGLPDDPKAWILRVAKNRAIDVLRRERFQAPMPDLDEAIDQALSPELDGENQLRVMFAVCDDALGIETQVTLILRWLCGLSPAEIARAFLVDVGTIDRRLHRGRARLAESDLEVSEADVRARQASVEQALYLLFNEGYHGSDVESPLHPAMCADALRLVELLLGASAIDAVPCHALAALFCLHSARLGTRLDDEGVIVPLADQDRSRWNRALIDRGIAHLGQSAVGERITRWHLEAGIAFEHVRAASIAETDWAQILAFYDALMSLAPGPIVALNRALAIAEARNLEAGAAALALLEGDSQLATYSFYWAARADVDRRMGRDPSPSYRRAIALAESRAERVSYERRLSALAS